jgi:hypothetical protein
MADLTSMFFADHENGPHLDDDEPPSLATLVDAVLDELDALLAETAA